MNGDDTMLREESDRIDGLLEELASMAGPQTWPRIEELMRRMVGLYGAAMERVLVHVHETGGLGPELEARLCGDDLVSSLLLLHGLHPLPTDERIRRALEELRPHVGQVELVRADPGGTVRLRMSGGEGSCPSSRAALTEALERAIHESAPEVREIVLEGAPRDDSGERLVTISIGRSKGR